MFFSVRNGTKWHTGTKWLNWDKMAQGQNGSTETNPTDRVTGPNIARTVPSPAPNGPVSGANAGGTQATQAQGQPKANPEPTAELARNTHDTQHHGEICK